MAWYGKTRASEILGHPRQTIYNMVRDGRLKENDRGQVWIEDDGPMLADHGLSKAVTKERPVGPDIQELRRIHQSLQNSVLKNELLKQQNTLISVEEVSRLWCDHIRDAKGRLLLIPDRITDPDTRELVRREILSSLAELSEYHAPAMPEARSK